MARIRVDQSHCNYHLAGYLAGEGWNVVFTDAGRVSRGGTGERGLCLDIFERNGFPIPDIASIKEGRLFLVEVDARLSASFLSIARYREAEPMILSEFSQAFRTRLTQLRLAFCQTGVRRADGINVEPPLDAYIVFSAPRAPVMLIRGNR